MKKNLHYNKHLSNYDQIKVIERLYKEDIKKRKEKKQTLLKVYECSFQPNLYYGSNNTNKNNQNRMMNTKSSRNFDKNNFMTYNNLVNRSLVLKNRKSNNNFYIKIHLPNFYHNHEEYVLFFLYLSY